MYVIVHHNVHLPSLRHFWFLVIFLVGAGLRVAGIRFGFPFFLHPDETKMVEPAITMAFSLKQILLTGDTSVLNPDFFFYPTFLMYFLAGIITLFHGFVWVLDAIPGVALTFTDFQKSDFYVLARFISVCFGMGTIILTYRLGERLRSGVGVLAALFLSVSQVHVLNSHYYTGDVPATFWIVCVLWCLVRAMQDNRDRWLFWAALGIGVGIGTKYYPGLLLVPWMVVVLLRRYGCTTVPSFVWYVARTCLVGGMIILVSFLMVAPFTAIDYSSFSLEMRESAARSRGGVFGYVSAHPFTYFTGGDPAYHEPFATNSLWQGMGSLVLIVALITVFYVWGPSGSSLLRLLCLYAIIHFSFFNMYPTKIVRWMLPLVPVGSIFAAWLLFELRERWRCSIRCMSVVVCILVAEQLLYTARSVYALTGEDTRIHALAWTREQIPAGSTVVFEYFSIPDFLSRSDITYIEISHPIYNVSGEIAASRAPDIPTLQRVSHPDFVIINGAIRDRFYTQDMQNIFPEAAASWTQFYATIAREYVIAAQFTPKVSAAVRAGPEIIVYAKKTDNPDE